MPCLLLLVALPMAVIAQLSEKEDKAQLAQFLSAYKVAKSNFAKNPKSTSAKTRFIAATDRFALASMTTGTLDRKVKYRQALHLYREVLKIDPKNHDASNNSALIISIYKQLGRPVPQG